MSRFALEGEAALEASADAVERGGVKAEALERVGREATGIFLLP